MSLDRWVPSYSWSVISIRLPWSWLARTWCLALLSPLASYYLTVERLLLKCVLSMNCLDLKVVSSVLSLCVTVVDLLVMRTLTCVSFVVRVWSVVMLRGNSL